MHRTYGTETSNKLSGKLFFIVGSYKGNELIGGYETTKYYER